MDFTDDECCTHSDLLGMIFDMSDLNIDQFDMNFGLTFFIYYGQFASTATRASSSTSRDFLQVIAQAGFSETMLLALFALILIPLCCVC